MSRERPILMSAPMVRALLSGAKTQTRRVVKPQPLGGAPTLLEHLLPHQRWATDEAEEEHVWKCPYGEPGRVLKRLGAEWLAKQIDKAKEPQ